MAYTKLVDLLDLESEVTLTNQHLESSNQTLAALLAQFDDVTADTVLSVLKSSLTTQNSMATTLGSLRTTLRYGGVDVSGANPLPVAGTFSDGSGVPYSEANPLPVDVGGSISLDNLTVGFESPVSTLNSRSTPMAADEVWIGQWEDVHNYSAIQVAALTDASSALPAGAKVQYSIDGTNVYNEESAYVLAGIPVYAVFPPKARYFRIHYTNGPVAQTFLWLEVSFRFNPPSLTLNPLGGPTHDGTIGAATKAHVTGRVPNELTDLAGQPNEWKPLRVTPEGRVEVVGPLTDDELRASPLDVAASSLPLPTGAATAAKQDAQSDALADILARLLETLSVSATSLPLPTGAATESTLALKFGGDKITLAQTLSTSGDNTLITPASGKSIRLLWLGLSTSQDNSAEVKVSAKFGANVHYKWNLGNPGAFSHWEPIEGAVNQPLVINLSVAQPVEVNYTYQEV